MLSCVVKLLDEDYVIYCIVNCRQLDKGSYCDHPTLVDILYVLSEIYSGLVHDCPSLKPGSSLMRCPSTIVATKYQYYIHVT